MRIAADVGASCILHAANRSQNTLRRLNGAFSLLGYPGRYGTPYDLGPIDREQKALELQELGFDYMSTRVASVDSNLWCREFESGILDDPENHVVPEGMYRWSVPQSDAPGARIEVAFKAGVPRTVDGTEMALDALIEVLNRHAGAYGVGRYSGLEHLSGGQKVLEMREMPAAWLLLQTYRHLEMSTLDAETIRQKMELEQIWVREALEGRWFGTLRQASQAFIDMCAVRVTGAVCWQLSPGTASTYSIVAENPLYLRNREDWEKSSIRIESESYRYS
jgi:argininosuccinate synthase